MPLSPRFAVPALLLLLAACGTDAERSGPTQESGPALAAGSTDPLVKKMVKLNERLRARGLNLRAEAVQFFTIGEGRPSARIHQQEFRWVPGDPRRLADGDAVTFIIDDENGETASGLTAAQTTAAIRRAMATWAADAALKKVVLTERPDGRGDLTIFDSFFGFGGEGDPFAADIVNAGWYPREFFEAVGGPGGGRGILAFSVSFIFTEEDGTPTDINGDGYLDTALNEVYYNDTFGDPRNDRVGNPWAIDRALPAIDVETVGLHENGHSLVLGHFGPPPTAVMNPVYGGIRHLPFAADDAGMSAVWASWPNP